MGQQVPMVLQELVFQPSAIQQNDTFVNRHDHSWSVASCTLDCKEGSDQNDMDDFHVFHDDTQEHSYLKKTVDGLTD